MEIDQLISLRPWKCWLNYFKWVPTFISFLMISYLKYWSWNLRNSLSKNSYSKIVKIYMSKGENNTLFFVFTHLALVFHIWNFPIFGSQLHGTIGIYGVYPDKQTNSDSEGLRLTESHSWRDYQQNNQFYSWNKLYLK